MANLAAESLSFQREQPEWGDAFIDKEVGKEPENDLYLEEGHESNLVTPEELALYIEHSANIDVELKHITFPPDIEVTLRLASEFYSTYLAGTNIDKIEAIDRYNAVLIEKVEAQARQEALEHPELALIIEDALEEFSEEVDEYALAVHAAALAEEKTLQYA